MPHDGAMIALLILLAPLVALIVWGVVYDLKRRRRGLPIHDVDAVARQHRERTNSTTHVPDRASIGDIGNILGP
jgi:hypothetical protein